MRSNLYRTVPLDPALDGLSSRGLRQKLFKTFFTPFLASATWRDRFDILLSKHGNISCFIGFEDVLSLLNIGVGLGGCYVML